MEAGVSGTGSGQEKKSEMRKTRRPSTFHIGKDKLEDDAPKATFVDAAAMKEKVRQNLSKPKHVVSDYYKTSGICQVIARSPKFDKLTLAVIGINALWIAFDTDYNTASLLVRAHPVFIIAENLFCAFFTFEWFTRYMSFRQKRDGLKDMWFIFDSFMVIMMVLETWFFTLITIFFLDDSAGGGNTGFFRAARLLRLSRMARMARLLRAMPELMIMIKGMMAATRSVFFTLCLEVIILYVFGIAFAQLANGTEVGRRYFSSVGTSMFTLLIYGTFLDNVSLFADALGEAPPYFTFMFFSFVLVGSLTVMNMLVGVLCEVVSATAAIEQEEMLVSYVHDKLSRVMAILDTDGGGTISKKEFIEILDNGDAVRCLNDVGVDVFSLVDLADYIFVDDDAPEEEELELDFGKFMEVVLQLRGTNQATVKDVVDLRKFVRLAMIDNRKQLDRILGEVLGVVRHQLNHPESVKVDAFPVKLVQAVRSETSSRDEIFSISVEGDCKDNYEVEDGSSPVVPQPTIGGQFLSISGSWVPTLLTPSRDGVALRGDWLPCGGEHPVFHEWRMPCEAEQLGQTDDAKPVEPNRLGDVTKKDSSFLAMKTTDGIDYHDAYCEPAVLAVDETDLEDVRIHVDTMSRHLATGLRELLAKIQVGMRNKSLRTNALAATDHLPVPADQGKLCTL